MPGSYMKFVAAVVEQLPRDLDAASCQKWVDGQAGLKRVLRKALMPDSLVMNPVNNLIDAKLELWRKYYHDHHGIVLDLGSVRIPAKQDGFDHLIVVAQRLTLNRMVEVGRKNYKLWLYREDLDRVVTDNDRMPTETYAIWVRDRQEADEEMANLSAEDVWAKKLTGETLLERLIHGDEEFTRIGHHLDHDNVTLCTGSRHLVGDVPGVGWSRGHRKVGVGWARPGHQYAGLRCRLAVL